MEKYVWSKFIVDSNLVQCAENMNCTFEFILTIEIKMLSLCYNIYITICQNNKFNLYQLKGLYISLNKHLKTIYFLRLIQMRKPIRRNALSLLCYLRILRNIPK